MRKPCVYFYCRPQGPADQAAYQHMAVALAEGLQALDIPFFSNINYWPLSPAGDSFLFNHSPDVSPDACDIVILNNYWFAYDYARDFPAGLFKPGRSYVTVYLDQEYGVHTRSFQPAFRNFDLIVKTHCNRRVRDYPANLQPWVIGLTNRMIDVTRNERTWSERDTVVLSNFRVKHRIRLQARRAFYPLLAETFMIDTSTDTFAPPQEPAARFEWEKTGRRHNPAYYDKLTHAQAVACFGGFAGLAFASIRQPQKVAELLDRGLPAGWKAIYQWDSFRLWEAFAAGCLVLHIDFANYGFSLPVVPENLQHYIGFDFADQEAIRYLLAEQPERLPQIAAQGRAWALEHYSPRPTAQRLLAALGW